MAAFAQKDRSILESVGKEIKENPPQQLAKTARKFGAQRSKQQRVAILLSKARAAGAKVPLPKKTF